MTFHFSPLTGGIIGTAILCQGVLYILLAVSMVFYPTMLGETDHQKFIVQISGSWLFLIAQIYVTNSIQPFIIREIYPRLCLLPKYMSKNANSKSVDCTAFAITTIFGRVIMIPIAIFLVFMTYGRNDEWIQSFVVSFLFLDIPLSLITWFIIIKYPSNATVIQYDMDHMNQMNNNKEMNEIHNEKATSDII